MARVLLRLKLSLVASSFRRGWQPLVGVVLAAVTTLPAAALGAAGLVLVGRVAEPGVAADVVVVVFTLLVGGWLLGPLVAFGMDETLDPARLQLLPVRPVQLLPGLALASLLGVPGVACVLLLAGVPAGLVPAGPGALLVVAGTLVELALCVLGGRALVTVLSGLLRSRRGRDAAALGGALVVAVLVLLVQVPNLVRLASVSSPDGAEVGVELGVSEGALDQLRGALSAAGTVLSALPPGWAARAVAAGAQGTLLEGVAWLAAALAAAALAAWVWLGALQRQWSGAGAGGSAASLDDDDLPLGPTRLLPAGPLAAAAAKDLRYQQRSPQVRAQMLPAVVLVLAFSTAGAWRLDDPRTVLLSAAAPAVLGFTALNLLGPDRGAFVTVLLAGGEARAELAGRVLALACVVAPVGLVAALALAAGTGGWAWLPVALALHAAVLGVSLGVGAVVSVLAPMPLADRSTNVFASNAGAGLGVVLAAVVGATADLVLLAVPLLLVVLPALLAPTLLWVTAPAAVVWGAAGLALGLHVGGGLLARRGPEVLAALSVDRAAQ